MVRNELSRNYPIYSLFASINGARLVTRNTQLVIEGYPRSANSFFEAAVRLRAGKDVKLAHHTHAAAQVRQAVRWSLPCVVLLRNPIDAAVSFLEESGRLSSPNVLLREYLIFYRSVAGLKDDVIFLSFETATKNTDFAVEYVAAKAQLPLSPRMGDSETAKQALEELTVAAQARVGIVPAYRRAQTQEEVDARNEHRRHLRDLVVRGSFGPLRDLAYELHARLAPLCL